jgi:hypothetical protein
MSSSAGKISHHWLQLLALFVRFVLYELITPLEYFVSLEFLTVTLTRKIPHIDGSLSLTFHKYKFDNNVFFFLLY